MRNVLARAKWHYSNGTLWYAFKKKLGKSRGGFRKPKGNQYYGEVARDYLQARLTQEWWHTEQAVMEQWLAEMPAGISVLDVPFGTGRFVPYYLKYDMVVHGVDISQEMISAAQEALGSQFASCTVTTGDATDLPYSDGSVDLVVSFRFLDVIIPFGAAKRALSEFSRVTRGKVVLELCERKESVARSRLPREDEVIGGMLYSDEVVQLLHSVGLRIVKKSEPIRDCEAWEMYAYLCERIVL